MENSLSLSAHNISVQYDEHLVLNDVSITLKQSEIVTLIGPNGAGKTSFIKVLLGLLEPVKGYVDKSDEHNISCG